MHGLSPQMEPHDPQLELLVERSTHAPPHSVSGGPHGGAASRPASGGVTTSVVVGASALEAASEALASRVAETAPPQAVAHGTRTSAKREHRTRAECSADGTRRPWVLLGCPPKHLQAAFDPRRRTEVV